MMFSSVSVFLPRSLLSRASKDGGTMNTNRDLREDFFTCSAPCTSMSSMQILPVSSTLCTAAVLVP